MGFLFSELFDETPGIDTTKWTATLGTPAGSGIGVGTAVGYGDGLRTISSVNVYDLFRSVAQVRVQPAQGTGSPSDGYTYFWIVDTANYAHHGFTITANDNMLHCITRESDDGGVTYWDTEYACVDFVGQWLRLRNTPSDVNWDNILWETSSDGVTWVTLVTTLIAYSRHGAKRDRTVEMGTNANLGSDVDASYFSDFNVSSQPSLLPSQLVLATPVIYTFTMDGLLSVGTLPRVLYNLAAPNWTFGNIAARVGSAPSGADINIDVLADGVSLLGGSILVIADGTTSTPLFEEFDPVPIPANASGTGLTVAVTQVGSTVPGADLAVDLYIS